MLCDVLLHVALDGTNVLGIKHCSIHVINNFVSGKESQGVRVILESFNDLENTLEIVIGVSSPWSRAVDRLANQRRVNIKDDVDTGIVKDAHAVVMVQVGIDIIHTDGVDTQALKENSITQTGILVHQRVDTVLRLISSLSTRLITIRLLVTIVQIMCSDLRRLPIRNVMARQSQCPKSHMLSLANR